MTALAVVKAVHVGCVMLTVSGFALRGVWMLRDSPLLSRPLVKVVPHVIDTVLLVSALWLVWATSQWPTGQDWLTAKIIGLVAYIVLGMVALRRGRSLAVRATAFVLALGVFGYIVAVAVTRQAAPGLNI